MHVPLEPELGDLEGVLAPAGDALLGKRGSWSLGVEDRQQPAGRVLALLLAENLQQFRSFEFGVLNDLTLSNCMTIECLCDEPGRC